MFMSGESLRHEVMWPKIFESVIEILQLDYSHESY